MHSVVKLVLDRQPDLGAGDESKCLPSWIQTFCEQWEKGEGVTLSHSAAGALLHTLIAAQQRARRLAGERDEAIRKIRPLESELDRQGKLLDAMGPV